MQCYLFPPNCLCDLKGKDLGEVKVCNRMYKILQKDLLFFTKTPLWREKVCEKNIICKVCRCKFLFLSSFGYIYKFSTICRIIRIQIPISFLWYWCKNLKFHYNYISNISHSLISYTFNCVMHTYWYIKLDFTFIQHLVNRSCFLLYSLNNIIKISERC